MKRFPPAVLAWSFAAAVLCLFSRPVLADTLTFTGVGGAGSDGAYIYPYFFTVTGDGQTATGVSLSCLNFNREITPGESWAVDAISIPMGTSTIDGESDLDFRADAWLFNQYSNPSYTATEVQFAIWSIMDPAGVAGTQGLDATAQTLAADALIAAATEPASYYANEVLFIPDTSSQSGWTDGEPQIFLGDPAGFAPAPEPSSLLLFATGLTGAAGIALRQKAQLAEGKAHRR